MRNQTPAWVEVFDAAWPLLLVVLCFAALVKYLFF